MQQIAKAKNCVLKALSTTQLSRVVNLVSQEHLLMGQSPYPNVNTVQQVLLLPPFPAHSVLLAKKEAMQ